MTAKGMAGATMSTGRLQEGLAQHGQGPAASGHVVEAEDVARRDAHQLVLAHPHELARRHDSSVLRRRRSAASATNVDRGRGRQRVVVADGGDELGVVLDGLDKMRLEPSRRHSRRAASGESRNVDTHRARR